MIASEKVLEIRRLLAQKQHSQRDIAALTGISRATIGAIAAGKRADYEEREARRAADGDLWGESVGPLVRCPGCGGRVHLPCRLCQVRIRQEQQRQTRRARRQRARFVLLRRQLLQARRRERQSESCGAARVTCHDRTIETRSAARAAD